MGIRDRPTSFRSPWQNGYVERLIGSIRRECTDHLPVFNAEHLRRILAKYATYYNEVRTHVSLGKDAPCRRRVERFGHIVAYPVLGGLHHRYANLVSEATTDGLHWTRLDRPPSRWRRDETGRASAHFRFASKADVT